LFTSLLRKYYSPYIIIQKGSQGLHLTAWIEVVPDGFFSLFLVPDKTLGLHQKSHIMSFLRMQESPNSLSIRRFRDKPGMT